MIRSLGVHVWLLLTFRHPMTGLPKTFAPWCAIVLAAASVGWFRWGSPSVFVGMMIACGVIGHFSPRLAVAYALLSIGVDLVAMPAELVNGGRVPVVFSAWEFAGTAVIVRREAQKTAL